MADVTTDITKLLEYDEEEGDITDFTMTLKVNFNGGSVSLTLTDLYRSKPCDWLKLLVGDHEIEYESTDGCGYGGRIYVRSVGDNITFVSSCLMENYSGLENELTLNKDICEEFLRQVAAETETAQAWLEQHALKSRK